MDVLFVVRPILELSKKFDDISKHIDRVHQISQLKSQAIRQYIFAVHQK